MKPNRVSSALLPVAAYLLTTIAAAALPVTLPPGMAPGDQYRLAFTTSNSGNAVSTDISDYNAFVTLAANSVPELAALSVAWFVIGSTSSISARENTGLTADDGTSLFRTDGQRVKDVSFNIFKTVNFGDLEANLAVDENGDALLDPNTNIFTGTTDNGQIESPLGSPTPTTGAVLSTDDTYLRISAVENDVLRRFYAISAPITVPAAVPIPAALPLVLTAFGSLALLRQATRPSRASSRRRA